MGSFENQLWKQDVFENPLAHIGLGLEERAEISTERTGLDLEVVLEQFRELDRRRPFDDPKHTSTRGRPSRAPTRGHNGGRDPIRG